MVSGPQIEDALGRALGRLDQGDTPPRLRKALQDAVLPGGGRLRPTLCLSVFSACCGQPPPTGVTDVAAALELLHCASLVHDDLPCFDDAPVRRGRPSVHTRHGSSLAILAGDGLIIMAFETIAGADLDPSLCAHLVGIIARAVGPARGLVAGQAWESEPSVSLQSYHAAKTGVLFEASARCGALIANSLAPETLRPQNIAQSIERWAHFGQLLGHAYQVADDLHDARTEQPAAPPNASETHGVPPDTLGTMGKPVGNDEANHRPNAALQLGKAGALHRLHGLLDRCVEDLPICADQEPVRSWLSRFGARLVSATNPDSVPSPDRSDCEGSGRHARVQ